MERDPNLDYSFYDRWAPEAAKVTARTGKTAWDFLGPFYSGAVPGAPEGWFGTRTTGTPPPAPYAAPQTSSTPPKSTPNPYASPTSPAPPPLSAAPSSYVQFPTYPHNAATDAERIKGQMLYSFEDAQTALDNVLRDKGFNPFAANPFMQTMRRQAQPLAQAYLINAATGGYPDSEFGNNWQDYSTDPYNFAGFLNNSLNSITTPGGGVYGRLTTARDQLPTALQAIRAMQNSTSGDVNSQNPFTQLLAQQMAQDNGQGATSVLRLLNGPLMASSLRDAYGTGLSQAHALALRSFMNKPDPLQGDIWQYLFGY